MKKTLILILFALSLAFTGCGFKDYTIPEKVTVKTGATYEFSVAKLDSNKQKWLDFSEYLDVSKMMTEGEGTTNSNGMEVLKYNNGSDYQQLLIHMPLKDMDFDLGETFKKMDFSKEMQNLDIKKEFKVPDVKNMTRSEDIDLSAINLALNLMAHATGTSAASASLTFDNVDSEKNFDTIRYSTGTLTINCATAGTVCLKTDSYTSPTATFTNGVASIDMAGGRISKTSILEFSEPGGTFNAAMDISSKVESATGVTLVNATVSVEPITFKVQMDQDITDCKVTEGDITIQIPNTEYNTPDIFGAYSITLSGGLEGVTVTNSTPVSLAGKTLANQEIVANSTITLAITDEPITLIPGPKVNVKVDIRKVTATVKMKDEYKLSVEKTQAVSDDLKNYVEVIDWLPSGFNVTGSHNLPDENDITLAFTSTFFNMDGINANSKHAIEPNKEYGSESQPALEFRGDPGITKFKNETPASPAPDGTYYSEITVRGDIVLPRFDSTNKTIEVKNVVPGSIYKIDLEVEAVYEWEKAWIKLADGNSTNMKDVFNANINKQELFKAFGDSFAQKYSDKINFASLPLYIYADMPDISLFENASYTGVIKAYYGKEKEGAGNEGKYEKLDGSPEQVLKNGTLALLPMPALTPNTEGFITAAMTAEAIPFQNALNMPVPALPAGVTKAPLCVDYDISYGSVGTGCVEITPDQMEEASAAGKSKIKIDVIIVMTMDFIIADGGVDINVMELVSKDSSGTKTDKQKDLFKRSEPTSTSDYQRFLDVVKTAELEMTKTKFPFQGNLSLNVQWTDEEPEKMPLSEDGKAVFTVNPSLLLKTYPLEPKIGLNIGAGPFGIKREMPMEATLKLRVKAEGPIQVYPFKDSEGGAD